MSEQPQPDRHPSIAHMYNGVKGYYTDSQGVVHPVGGRRYREVRDVQRTVKIKSGRDPVTGESEFLEIERGDPTFSYYVDPERFEKRKNREWQKDAPSVVYAPAGLSDEDIEMALEKDKEPVMLPPTDGSMIMPEEAMAAEETRLPHSTFYSNIPTDVLEVIGESTTRRRKEPDIIVEIPLRDGKRGPLKAARGKQGKEVEYLTGIPSEDPRFKRPAEDVLKEVKEGRMTPEQAKQVHGVSLAIRVGEDPSYHVNWKETGRLRSVVHPRDIRGSKYGVTVGHQTLTPDEWDDFQRHLASFDAKDFTMDELKTFLTVRGREELPPKPKYEF